MKGARLTRSSVSSRGSIERSSEEVTSGQFPETQIGEIRQCGTHKPLCLPIQRTQGRRFYDPKYRETSPVAVVLDTPQQLTTVNWRSSIFELTPFESKGFLSWGKGRGEAASFATTWGHGRKTIRVGERPTRGPCQSSFSRNGKRWLRKKKRKKERKGRAANRFRDSQVKPRREIETMDRVYGSIRGSFERWKRRFESLVNNKAECMRVYRCGYRKFKWIFCMCGMKILSLEKIEVEKVIS